MLSRVNFSCAQKAQQPAFKAMPQGSLLQVKQFIHKGHPEGDTVFINGLKKDLVAHLKKPSEIGTFVQEVVKQTPIATPAQRQRRRLLHEVAASASVESLFGKK